ncbi:MAG: SHOCT domain-containing protein [Pseudomonadota bacterium]
MMHWTGMDGWMGGGWIFMALFWVLIILAVVVLIRRMDIGCNESKEAPRKTPIEIIKERYARGEIEREEYEQKRRDLDN